MTFLELVRKTWQLCGLSGPGPSDVADQSDMHGRIVQYVQDAYLYVQQQHDDWGFMWDTKNSQLEPGQSEYLPGDFGITAFREISRLLIADTSGQYTPLERDLWAVSAPDYDNLTPGEPTRFVRTPSQAIRVNKTPEAVQPIRVEYYKGNDRLVTGASELVIPVDYQDTVIFKAMEYYAHYDEDAAMLLIAEKSYLSAMVRLERNHLPRPAFDEQGGFS